MAHNKALFPQKNNDKKSIILTELNIANSTHIAYSYIVNILAKKHSAKIIAYTPRAPQNIKQKLAFWIKKAMKVDHYGVYQSFGVSEFLSLSPSKKEKNEAKKILTSILPKIKSIHDIENLTIDNAWIGDLIYDTYLRAHSLPTIDIESLSFRQHLQESLELFVVWKNYLNNNDVKAINVSHCVYNLAIPLRLAIPKKIPVYQVNLTHSYRMKQSNMFAYNDFHYFPKRFMEIPEIDRSIGLAEAKKRIERRFSGEVGVDMGYSKKSAYSQSRHNQLLKKTSKKKILIAAHCFFDSPHSYGKNLFPDFYEWLNFLGTISEKTDYDWYIKTHPDYLQGTKAVIEKFTNRYPKFTLLPSDSSHHQIIAEGIDLALSVYGTIGFEYAALGIPVINASRNNPHIAYNFNLHPKTVDEYRDLLVNLENLDFSINIKEVYEYYFMRFIFNTQNLFFNNYEKVINNIGGYSNQFKSEIYNIWQQEFTKEKHQRICKALERFVDSGDFRMDHSHFGEKFNMKHIKATQ